MVRLAAILLGLAACGSARVIEQTRVGGTLELSGDRGKAMDQADREMATQCGAHNSTIIYSGYELIGGGSAVTPADLSNGARAQTAYRVHYQCNGALAP